MNSLARFIHCACDSLPLPDAWYSLKYMEQEKQFANLFGNEPDIAFDEKMRVLGELNKIGSLTFKVEKHTDGWVAECQEVPAIITGNTNPEPSNFEIESLIREAVFSAFNVRFMDTSNSVASPLRFEYQLESPVLA